MTTGFLVAFGVMAVRALSMHARRRRRASFLVDGRPPRRRTISFTPRSWVAAAWQAIRVLREASAYDAALAVALDGLARAVRGGGSLQSAIGEAATGVTGLVGDDLRRVAGAVQRGMPLDVALAEWRSARDRASVRLATGAIALAAKTGGPPARVIEDVAASLRVRMQVEGEARSLGAQARLSALVVGVAPVGFALVACASDTRNARLMFGTPIGVACVVVGLALDVAGALWMNRISETVLR